MELKERLREYILSLGISTSEFERNCGLSNGYVNNIRKGIGLKSLEQILNAYPSINREWLLSGTGKSDKETKHTSEKRNDIVMIPIVNLDARGGFGSNDVTDTPEYYEGFMPFSREVARQGDIVVPVYGDSMTPKFPSGSYILIRNIPMWKEYVELGAPHVLELTDDRRLLKNIQRSSEKDCFLLESINPKYEPTDISKKLIRRIFRVLMAVRRETL